MMSDLISGALKNGTDFKECCHDLIWSAMWIWTDNRGWCHDVNWGDLWIGTNSAIMLSWHIVKCYVDWKWCDMNLARPIWSKMWIRREDRRCCHDWIWGDIWIGTDVKACCIDQIKVLCGLAMMWQEAFTTNLK
jgi:hypothetical protein